MTIVKIAGTIANRLIDILFDVYKQCLLNNLQNVERKKEVNIYTVSEDNKFTRPITTLYEPQIQSLLEAIGSCEMSCFLTPHHLHLTLARFVTSKLEKKKLLCLKSSFLLDPLSHGHYLR